MSRRWRAAIAIAVTLAVPALAGTTARAASIHSQAKGKQAIAQFAVFDTVNCGGTRTESKQTFFSILSFETSIRMQGQLTTTLETDVFVSSFDPCTFEFFFASAQVFGGDLPMTALDRATLAGHYVLSDGKVLDLNLTLTGTDTTSQGHTMQRRNFGNVMIITRQIGSSRTANISGTVTYDGRVIQSSQMSQTDANLSRNTGGEILVIRSGL